MEGNFTFSKQDILCNLRGTVPEARSKDTEVLQEGTIALPTTATIGGVEPCPAKTHRADDTILASPRCTPNDEFPPAEPTTLPAEINLPWSADISLRGNTMMPSAKIDTDTPNDLATVQATSPAEAESWVVPTTGLVEKLTGPPTPSDLVGGEKECVLMVTTSVRKLILEVTGVTSRDTVIASVRRVAFGNPLMAASLSGSPKEKREEGGWPLGCYSR